MVKNSSHQVILAARPGKETYYLPPSISLLSAAQRWEFLTVKRPLAGKDFMEDSMLSFVLQPSAAK